jgi:hypothetical protein
MMKKLLLILLAFTMLSCGDDCVEQAQIQYIGQSTKIDSTNTKDVQIVIITQDTCYSESTTIPDSFRILDGVTVTVNGDFTTQGSLQLVKNAKLNVTGSIPFTSTVFFIGGSGTGVIDVDGSIFVGSDTNANAGSSGIVYYGATMVNQAKTGNVTLIQDATPLENPECTTLTDGGLNSSLGGFIDVPCGYDFVNQKVKTDENGNTYIYIELD